MGHVGHAYVESDDAIVSCIISLCCAMCHMDLIDVILSRMTSMSFPQFGELRLLACRHMSVVRKCMVYKIDSWSRDATSFSIIAYSIPGLHLYFRFCLPLCPTFSHLFPFP